MSMMLNYCSFTSLIKSRLNGFLPWHSKFLYKKTLMKIGRNVLFQYESSVLS